MSGINSLNSTNAVTASDQFVVYKSNLGDTQKVPASVAATYFASTITAGDNKNTQYSAPLTGATVTVTNSTNSVWLILTPAGTIATLTITLPALASSTDKQEVLVNCTQIVTALTVDGNGSSVVGAPTAFTANGYFRLRFDAVLSTWYRVG